MVYWFWPSSYISVFQPGFRGTSVFREWLPGIPPKQTETKFTWDEIHNHSPMRLQQYRHLDHCIGFHE